MNRKNLMKCLTSLSLIKKINLSKELEDIWFEALRGISDGIGESAFQAVYAKNTYGTAEPADVLAEAEKIKNQNILNQPYQWVKDAPKFEGSKDYFSPSEEFKQFLKIERNKKYLSKSSHGEVCLVRNPEAWDWKITAGTVTMIRPRPIPTGTILAEQKPKSSRNGMWDRW